MAKDTVEPKITLPGTDREVSVAGARKAMAKLAEDASSLAQDESSGAKSKRIEIAGKLRAIQAAIDATEELCVVHIPTDATKQFPFRIGEVEFFPGDHTVRASVAQTLRYMMDQHRHVEHHIHVAGGNFDPTLPGYSGYGKELPLAMNDLTTTGVRVSVQRHVTEEETLVFEGWYATPDEANHAALSHLAACRTHMIALNEQVRLVDAKKAAELDAEIESKGAEVKKLTADLAELRLAIAKGAKRVDSSVRAAG